MCGCWRAIGDLPNSITPRYLQIKNSDVSP
jgi:hypothetical protein